MNKWIKWLSTIRLRWFDFNSNLHDKVLFGRNLFNISWKGITFSIFLLIILLAADFFVRKLVYFLNSYSNDSVACQLANLAYNINYKIGLKNVNYLVEVVSVSAGVLGVILGLFYTAFITIISTKYSNINSVISFQLLEQKSINRYFVLLAALTSLSILFQVFLSLGYSPTIISIILFSILIVAALTSFIRFGKYALVYFDTSYLVNDLIHSNYRTLAKIIKVNSQIDTLGKGRLYLKRIYQNIDKIQLIIRESQNPQTRNTSLNVISDTLLDFSIYYNSVKQTIPSKKGWHLQTREFRAWDEAKEWDFSLLKNTGVNILPETVDAYNLMEKKFITTQFELFHHYVTDSDTIEVLMNQNKYLQIIAIQCDFETIEYFFNQLKIFLIEKLKTIPTENQTYRLQLVSLFPYLLIALLVGFNDNLSGYDNPRLKKLAKAIHFNNKTDKILQFPYFIRKWLDSYHEKQITEKTLEGKFITPLFYTEFELAQTFQYEIQNFWNKIVLYIIDNISQLSKTFIENKSVLEALHLNMESIELCKKISFFTNTTNEIILSFNDLNFQKHDSPFEFKNQDDLLKKNDLLKEQILANIWEVGISAYQVKKNELPDMYGNFYHLILNDIIDKLFVTPTNEKIIQKYLSKFFVSCTLYIEHLREKYKDSEYIEFSLSRLFPLIIDMYEVSAIAILISKISNKEEIIDSILKFWDTIHNSAENELHFWKWINAIYSYFKHPLYGLSTPSYFKEQDRKTRFENYLIENKIVREEIYKGDLMKSYMEHYVSDSPDFYVKAAIRSMYAGSISLIELDEVFVEFYLRTRIALKELDIKETHYGEQLRRTMEK